MKILINTKCFPGAAYFIIRGWQNVLEKLGHTCVWWQNNKPAFDIFSEVEPDIYIGAAYDLDRATLKCLEQRPNLKTVLKGKNWGELDDKIDTAKYPIDIMTAKEKEAILKIKPTLVFNYYAPKHMTTTMGGWENNGIATIGLQPAADIYTYLPHAWPQKSMESDLCFCGGYWGYKAQNIDSFIAPLCYPVGKYNVKIFGHAIWPFPQYLGSISIDQEKTLFASTKIGLNISEPHATALGWECNERPFKYLLSKTFCISDYVEGYRDIFTEDELVMVKTPQELQDAVDKFLSNAELRQEYIDRGYKAVLKSETYNHRLRDLLLKLGYEDDAAKSIQLLEDVV